MPLLCRTTKQSAQHICTLASGLRCHEEKLHGPMEAAHCTGELRRTSQSPMYPQQEDLPGRSTTKDTQDSPHSHPHQPRAHPCGAAAVSLGLSAGTLVVPDI